MTREMTAGLNSPRDPFRLANLPQCQPATDAWPQIESALRRRQLVRRTTAWLAAAAMVTLAIGVYWQLPRIQPHDRLALPKAGESQLAENVRSPAMGTDSLEALVSLSQRLEKNLRAVRAEAGVVRHRPLGAVL